MLRILAYIISLSLCFSASAENWPGWRGPRGDGTTDQTIVLSWDGQSGKNVRWKQPITGVGHSSPIIWEDRIFLTTCIPESRERLLLCLDRTTGQERWSKTVLEARLESKHARNSYASSTPATDGQYIYVTFLEASDEQILAPNVGSERLIHPGKMVVAAYDFDGNQKWMVRPGQFISAHGLVSNPVIWRDTVIVNGDHDGDSYLVALDRETGDLAWKTPRRHRTRSYVTPIIRHVAGRHQLVLSGSKCIASFNPDNGSRLWNVEGPTEQFVASMVFDGNRFFAVGGYPTHHVMAIRPNGMGDVTDSHVLWHKTNVRAYVPSPVVVDDFLLVADDRGTANCFDTRNGKRLWQTRMGNHYRCSLLAANGPDGSRLVMLLASDGTAKLLRPGPKLEVVAENALGEDVHASPAVADGQLFLRGEEHLFCIAKSED